MGTTTPISQSKKRKEAANSDSIACFNPGTLEPLGEVENMRPAQVLEIVARARKAQPQWANASFAERKKVFRALLDYVLAHQDEIADVCVKDSGKTRVDALLGEVIPVCEKLRYVIQNGERDLAAEPRSSGFLVNKRVRVEYPPLGVVGVICPFNFPFHNVFCPAIPALFAGNAVVLKVSEWTSWSAKYFQSIFDAILSRFGYSTDLVQLVTGDGQTGSALVTSGVEKIFFTGSPQNGKKVMAAAVDTLTPVILELGGKDPMIICDDAPFDHAVSTAMLGVFTACGQMCVGAERIYVMDGIYDRFVAEVVRRVSALRQGPASEDKGGEFDVGAQTMPRQLDIIEKQVNDAVKKGAKVLVGGKRNTALNGQFWLPTVLADVTHEMAITQEETFGPVMTIIRVKDEDEAIRLANDCAYGLGSSVFTKNAARGERIAKAISAGMAVVNDYGLGYMMQSAPFGGLRVSGFGRINGREGLRACTAEKTVVTDRIPMNKSVGFYPISAITFPLVRDVTTLLYAGSLGARLSALASAAKTVLGKSSPAR
ncbi:MAG: aldehyde dehydrogenase family protein [Deltaproteobacteria bacterium]|nr:aldehyde dehydrogenase family protein [Deltaproteobacteria bacterium]